MGSGEIKLHPKKNSVRRNLQRKTEDGVVSLEERLSRSSRCQRLARVHPHRLKNTLFSQSIGPDKATIEAGLGLWELNEINGPRGSRSVWNRMGLTEASWFVRRGIGCLTKHT